MLQHRIIIKEICTFTNLAILYGAVDVRNAFAMQDTMNIKDLNILPPLSQHVATSHISLNTTITQDKHYGGYGRRGHHNARQRQELHSVQQRQGHCSE